MGIFPITVSVLKVVEAFAIVDGAGGQKWLTNELMEKVHLNGGGQMGSELTKEDLLILPFRLSGSDGLSIEFEYIGPSFTMVSPDYVQALLNRIG